MKNKYLEILVCVFLLIPLLVSAQVHLVSSGFNAAGGDAIGNQSFDYSFGEVIASPLETNNVQGNIGLLQIIPDNMTAVGDAIFSELSIAPNPSLGVFEILNTGEKNYSYRIYSTDGTLKAQGEDLGHRHTIDLSAFTSGVYILNISDGKNLQNFKLLKI